MSVTFHGKGMTGLLDLPLLSEPPFPQFLTCFHGRRDIEEREVKLGDPHWRMSLNGTRLGLASYYIFIASCLMPLLDQSKEFVSQLMPLVLHDLAAQLLRRNKYNPHRSASSCSNKNINRSCISDNRQCRSKQQRNLNNDNDSDQKSKNDMR